MPTLNELREQTAAADPRTGSVAWLARQLHKAGHRGIGPHRIDAWEKGELIPNARERRTLAAIFGVKQREIEFPVTDGARWRGADVKAARLRAALTLSEVGGLLGISKQAVSAVECRDHVSSETAERIFAAIHQAAVIQRQ